MGIPLTHLSVEDPVLPISINAYLPPQPTIERCYAFGEAVGRVGETMVSRIAGAQLQAIGLPELITGSVAEYEALAVALARQPELLAQYRARLAANRHTHPLFDMTRYARDFEDAMQRIWDEHCRRR